MQTIEYTMGLPVFLIALVKRDHSSRPHVVACPQHSQHALRCLAALVGVRSGPHVLDAGGGGAVARAGVDLPATISLAS